MSTAWAVGTVVPMARAGDTGEALEAARRLLAVRDADLAEADRALSAAVADAHDIAAEAIGRIEAIAADVEAAVTDHSRDSAAAARDVARHLVAKNREIADVISQAKDAVNAKTLALKELTGRYTQR